MSVFRVDTVPTPRLDLYGALQKDMRYYGENHQTLPPAQLSALVAEQEKINRFLQYVNESFIMKGFSKGKPLPQTAEDSDVTAAFNQQVMVFNQQLTPIARFSVVCGYASHLYICWSLSGTVSLPAAYQSSGAVLQVQLFIDNEATALWQQTLLPGEASIGRSIFLPDRQAGSYAVEIEARMAAGSLTAPIAGAYASGFAKLKGDQT